MSHQIDPKAKLLLMSPKNNVEIPGNFKEIFLYSISPELKTKIAKSNQYKALLIYGMNQLFACSYKTHPPGAYSNWEILNSYPYSATPNIK